MLSTADSWMRLCMDETNTAAQCPDGVCVRESCPCPPPEGAVPFAVLRRVRLEERLANLVRALVAAGPRLSALQQV